MHVESIRSICSVYKSAAGHAPRGGAKGLDLADAHMEGSFIEMCWTFVPAAFSQCVHLFSVTKEKRRSDQCSSLI